MTCPPTAFYSIADRLHAGLQVINTDNACTRTVAGRLYYAAYLATRDTLRTYVGRDTYAIDHSRLTDLLRFDAKDPWVNTFGEQLELLRQKRTKADYRLTEVVTRREIGMHLRDCKFILDSQAELLQRLRAEKVKAPPA